MRQYQAMDLTKPASVKGPAGLFRKHPDAAKRRSPYFYTSDKPRALGREGFGGYLNGRADRIGEASPCDLRVIACHEVDGAHIEHTGWYSDDDCCGELMYGVVVRLPHARGFLVGWSMGANMCASIEPDIYPDAVAAARAADRVAEIAAEKERAYQAKCEARRTVDDAREQIAHARAEHSQLIRALAKGIGDDATGARMRERVRESVASARETIESTLGDFGDDILTEQYVSAASYAHTAYP